MLIFILFTFYFKAKKSKHLF